MFDEDTLAALEIQYLAIQELVDIHGKMPSRDEVIAKVESMIEPIQKGTLSLVQ